MKFDKPATQNPIDQQNVVGRPRDRIDGPLKTSGQATYAYEWHDEAPNAAYGHVVGSAIAKGRITAMDTGAAEQAPGVLAVITAQNAGPLGKGDMNAATLLGGPEIEHYHQAIAVVVAETFEQARAAAGLITVTYEETPGAYDLAKEKPGVTTPPDDTPDKTVGDFGSAFNHAEVQFDATYTTPDQSHMAMEPHASMAAWEGDKLTLWTSSQMINWWRGDLAKTLNIPLENIRVRSPYIGGGFGSKLFLRSDAVLAALGARAVQRPVKVMLPRPFIPNNTTHRPATIQRVRLGARRDGRLTAIAHESWSGNLPGGPTETATNQTELLYAGANRHTGLRLAELDLPEGNSMRAPGEAPGMMVLEIAIDEMAEKLGMDPVEFRIINDTQVDPAHPERFFSRRQLVECLRTGAAHFGWQQRNPVPGQVREGDWLVGHGMAAGFRNNLVTKSGARVHLDAQGQVTVETDMTDIGTGSYTIIAQTAAEMMGVPLESVTVRLGDSDYPISSGSGGQWGANSATAGVYAACVKLREAAAKRLGFDPNSAEFVDGQIRGEGRRVPLAQVAADGTLTAEDTMEYGALDKQFQQSTFAGHFVEVAVEANTGEVRVRRMLAVCAAGRILNPKTARSQVIGAMTMGLGGALMEELFVDTRRGFFVNHDMALYEVPVHADVPRQEVIFLEDTDPVSSPMKAKGVGELGLCGVSAAIANAIYNATGVRVREYPITLDKLLEGLPELAS
ncbi:Periplasmic aromatic aldehyde oxidoreductase,molybdenum binding subunit YagR [Cronobacter dublinensis 1210]|uniref:Periplasmic aromatic aldehyde oxidoreductase,molybdenum binding subunit YagR n=3 Tax=Cronobacter dublinensis TaxID=413497 RepID=A0ABM9Q557_9ENTR|nr:aldehyde oxidoreductase molybdenum-binding subunit PaoC [Cronobacter dublinensis]ALB68646.1 xanthine dehydrogenase [Cronobacter dublinensis subsp. dublinensis LMG 23823]MDI7273525.1 aldehyde oxidoreductase molybdenum-binding subunit PaoC [Cronobacter dublinensis]CCJ80556.1 Periplasmic aromatic aldehyde oxidoreductase,molybdenum binding subunit YagR [Cronobacter dublinensis 1210]